MATRILTLVLLLVLAPMASASPAVGARKGYLDDVKLEERETLREVVVIPVTEFYEAPLKDRIFDAKLTKELQQKYESEFGYTDVQRNTQSPSRYADLRYDNGVRVTAQEDIQRRQRFGEFMTRKVAEYHVDRYMKTEPSMRPVYEAKQALSNVAVKIRGGYKLNANYSLSDNSVALKLDNPLGVTNRLLFEFNDPTYGEETLFYLAYPINKKLSMAGDYRFSRGSWSAILTRQISYRWSASVSALYVPVVPEEPKMENRYLLGFTWTN